VWPALLGKLLLGPAAGDDDPGPGLLRFAPDAIFSSASFSVGTPIQFTSVPKVSAARMPWMCPSVSPGITVRPPRSISFARLAGELLHRGEAPVARILPSPIATACCVEKSLSTVRMLPLNRIVSAVCADAMPAGDVTMKAAAK
jgi:hypothetical protein